MKRFVLFLCLVDDKVWGIYVAVEEKKYVALDDQAAVCEGKTTGLFSLTFLQLVLLTVGGSTDKGSFGKSSDEARSRVGGAKIEWNTPLFVREGCWREFQVATLVGYRSLGFRKLCSKEVPKISSSGEPL